MRALNSWISGLFCAAFLLSIVFASALPSASSAGQAPAETPAFPDAPSGPGISYIPALLNSTSIADITLTAAWAGDAQISKTAFLRGAPLHLVAGGANQSTFTGIATLSWTLISNCGSTVVYSNTHVLGPGTWTVAVDVTVPQCLGIYIVTAEINNHGRLTSRSTIFTVLPPSTVVLTTRQAFDRCSLPTTAQMQTWWDNSPYDVFNIYLGGIQFACPANPLDAFWVDAVSQQGWDFILAWVGPQAPCSNYAHRMSSNLTTAYQQGRSEADLAAARAAQMGILGTKIIYYDLESYSNATDACRNAVEQFMRGWTERLHDWGAKAGAYGSPCTSYISDWSTVTPRLDDVWIAHWLLPFQYRPDASVYGTACLSDTLWNNHRRLRQYAGGHSETWGGTTLIVDSSATDGEVTSVHGAPLASSELGASAVTLALPPQVRLMEQLTAESGWVVLDERLLWTGDAGRSWQDITPASGSQSGILSVSFRDTLSGWLVRHSLDDQLNESLEILISEDQGQSWQEYAIPLGSGAMPVHSAYLDFIDAQTGWLALKLQSGSSFSLGRLFATQDGGRTWMERSLPLGEPVHFLDAGHGWVAGGPAGDQFYQTQDGGITWQAADRLGFESAIQPTFAPVAGAPEGVTALDFVSQQSGWALVQEGICAGDKVTAPDAQPFICTQRVELLKTSDGGQHWETITPR